MTPTLTDPRQMVAVSADSDVTPLGYIVWFSVPDLDVSVRRLRRVWQLSGLDPKPLPSAPGEVNAFRRAVRGEEGRIAMPDGTIMETDVRDIPTNDGYVVYQLSRVVKDADEQIVTYPKAMRVKYHPERRDIDFEPLGEIPRKHLLPIMDSIQERFDLNVKAITGAKVRALVRDYIKNDDDEKQGKVGLSGENMRGKAGGVYFVLSRYADQITALAEFLGEMYPQHDSAGLYSVPMADGATERDMIRRQHVANSIAEIEEEVGEVRDLLREDRKRDVRNNVLQHHFQRLEQLKRRAAQYSSALREEQEDVTAHLDVLNIQLRKLLGA
jgi:NTP pyrophosphatase (non-canonical NTP hydrolase)